MRSLFTLALVLLSACGASEVQSQRLKDGSWSFQCELSMDECIRKVQDNCPQQRYQILEGSSQTRLRDVPPFEKAYHTSKLRLMCNNDSGDALISFGGDKKAPAAPAASSAPAAPVAKPVVCTQGQTRECVGAGACKGGQSCLGDGTGYGACDCGPGPTAPSAADAPAPVPATSASP